MIDDIIDQLLKEGDTGGQNDDSNQKQYTVDDLIDQPSELEDQNNQYADSTGILGGNDLLSVGQESSQKVTKETVNKNKIEIPKDLNNPLDIVNYIEIDHFKEMKLEECFPLRKHKESQNYKINSLEFEPLQLSNEIFRDQGVMYTSMLVKKDLLYLGTAVGDVVIFSFQTKKKIKVMTKPKDLKQAPVDCIDVSDDGRFLFCGHENGLVAMYDVASGKCKTLINNLHYKTCINIKFFKQDKKNYYFISSDNDGNVYKSTIYDGMLSYKFDGATNIYTHNNDPTFLIELIKIPQKFIEENQKSGMELDLPPAAIFSTASSVYLYTLEPEMQMIFEFPKPHYIPDSSVPDVAYGIGKPPSASGVNTGEIKNRLLLTICWGKVIYVFVIPLSMKQYNDPILVGYYVSPFKVLRVGFLAESLIYFFDEQKFIKLLDSRKMNIGNVQLNEKDIIVPKDNNKAELDPGRLNDPDIKYQSVFRDKNNQPKRTFINFIQESNSELYLLSKSKIYIGKLIDWKKCIQNTLTAEEWENLLVSGIEIYQNKIPSLAGIPQDEAVRKREVGQHLQDTISQYVLNKIRKATLASHAYEDGGDRKEISYCIDVAIEFCIEIEKMDYLLSQIMPQFEEKEYSNLFLEKLEPFILAGKIQNINLDKEILSKIFDLYIRNQNTSMLSQICLHMNYKNLYNEEVGDDEFLKKMEEHKIFTPLIYICSNKKEEDYFTPLTRIFDSVKFGSTDSRYGGSLKDFCKTVSDLNEIKKTKEYYAYLIFWYIRWFLTQKKFPDNTQFIDNAQFQTNLCTLTYWLLSREVFKTLNLIDSECYFEILGKIFSSKNFVGLLADKIKKDDKFKIDSLHFFIDNESSGEFLTSIDPLNLIKYLIAGKDKLSNQAKIYLYSFVAHASYANEIPPEIAFEAAGYLLENYSTYIPDPVDATLFKISRELKQLFHNEANFNREIYLRLLSKNKTCPLDEFKMFLYNKTNTYRQCLDLFLDSQSKLENKKETLISFLNNTLTTLQKANDSSFGNFKNEILIRIVDIGNLMPENLNVFVQDWFTKEKKSILSQLEKDPKLELVYIQQEVNKINEIIKEENNIDVTDEINEILKLHIQLLCILNQPEKILPALKENSYYPDDVLNICKAHRVYDAAIYLLQYKGDPEAALNLAISVQDDLYKTIISNLKDPNFDNENAFLLVMQKFISSISQCTEICEKNEQQNNKALWFSLLDKLYEYFNCIKTKDTFLKKELTQHPPFFDEFEEKLSKEIKILLEKVCSYVSIKDVFEKYKDAELSEFKAVLTRILNNYSNLTTIYMSTKDLLRNSVIFNVDDLLKDSSRGNNIEIDKCDECEKKFDKFKNRGERILVFHCGHISHDKCAAIEEDDLVCSVCRRNEVESSIISSKEKVVQKGGEVDLDEEEEEGSNVSKENRDYFNKLKNFEKAFSEKLNNMMDQTIEIEGEEEISTGRKG